MRWEMGDGWKCWAFQMAGCFRWRGWTRRSRPCTGGGTAGTELELEGRSRDGMSSEGRGSRLLIWKADQHAIALSMLSDVSLASEILSVTSRQ